MRYILFFSMLSLPFFLKAQSTLLNDKEIQKEITAGLNKMYNLEFEAADAYFIKVREKYPEHPAYALLKSMSLTWEMLYKNSFAEQSQEDFKYITQAINLANNLLEKNPNDPEGVFFILAGHASMALYDSQMGQTIKAVNEARKAYGYMKKANKLKEEMVDFYFPVGLYNYYVVQYPENHPVFKPFMFFFRSGDKKKGLEQLDICARKGVYSKTEALFYLSNIYLRYEENYGQTLKYSSQLIDKYPQNIYFRIIHCEALIGTGAYKKAEYFAYDLYKTNSLFAKIAAYTYYGLLNESYFNKPNTAKTYFLQAINLSAECKSPTFSLIGQCYAGLGRYYAKKGEKDKAVAAYKKCLEITDYISLMKESEDYLDKNE